MMRALQHILCTGVVAMLAYSVWATESAATFDCNAHPDSCVVVNYQIFVPEMKDVREGISKQLAIIEAVAAEQKLKVVLQNQNYSVSKDEQTGTRTIYGGVTYALQDAVAAATFTAALEKKGFQFGAWGGGEICSH